MSVSDSLVEVARNCRDINRVRVTPQPSWQVLDSKLDFERYWMSPEFIDFRVMHSSYYQVPVVYGWTDLVVGGALPPEAVGAPSAPDENGTARGDLAG